jgi:mercuric ion binding protein
MKGLTMTKKLSMTLLAATLFAAPTFAAEQTVTLDVPGMTCASCPYIVQSAISGVDGVISVVADSDTRTAVVVYEDTATTVDEIAQASTDAGYDAALADVKS